ncbi:MAG: alpha-ketoglutarate-dependent dioxygenase AlkB [Rhodospirillales bacterium]|nr:alpha-ketoglutarate-dependent dioxygenase AlkB [Rhodospirillales bacterium]MDH3791768.1 alpha-ketoglutarate-dependent dioxygenase AlkB [Rhodospirillales bacterium]MDH3912720.1 alpha-ketoglutarate-dependent dioxygenase AlkB [Rhodospirillales bacterium]
MEGAPWPLAADLETELAAALGRLAIENALALPLLGPAERGPLVEAAERLSYRAARPMLGEGERTVRQDFELCMTVESGSPFHALAAALERAVAGALARLNPPPLAAPPRFNDLIVQRYRPGSLGITPHRDHIRYRDLVAIVTLAGRARFFLCADRSGCNAREVPIPPGSLLLMRAPGFGGLRDRPFHMLSDVTETRISLGLRHDVEAG